MPQITTVIPTYRRPQLLARAIRSVLAQSYRHFEIHVYDNASGDETPEVVAEFAERDPRVKYHCHPHNIGMMENFAHGISHVSGPFLNILSDDDIILPDLFAGAIDALAGHPEVAMYMGSTIRAYECGVVRDVPVVRYKQGMVQPPEGLFQILKNGHTDWTGCLFRKKAIDAVGGLDGRVGSIGDVDVQLRVAAEYPIFVSRTPGAVFFSHPTQASASPTTIDETLASWSRVIENLRGIKALDGDERKLAGDILVGLLRRRILRAGGDAARRGCYGEATRAAQVLKNELDGNVAAACMRILCVAARIVPAFATRLLTRAVEQIQRVFQKTRYGLTSGMSSRQCRPYGALVRDSLARLTFPDDAADTR